MPEDLRSAAAHRKAWLSLVLLAPALASCSLEGTSDVPGDVRRFDPIASYPAITAAAGPGAHFFKLEAKFVREDGTQDLEASYTGYSAVDEYQFVRASNKAEDPSIPVGARAPAAPFEEVHVTIQKPHWVSQTINGGEPENKKHRGMGVDIRSGAASNDGISPPSCSFAKLWAAARQRGAPAGSVAAILYDASGYQFRIDGTDFHLRFDAACAPQPETKL